MLEKFKNLSSITKILYLLSLILFILWVIPSITGYYNDVNTYQKNSKEIKIISSKYDIKTKTKEFSQKDFLKDTQLLFSQVKLITLKENNYNLILKIKQEDLKKFRTFIETLSLRYYVKVKDNLEFTVKDKVITVKMQLVTF